MNIENIWVLLILNPLEWWWTDKTDGVISLNHAFSLYCEKCCKNEHELNWMVSVWAVSVCVCKCCRQHNVDSIHDLLSLVERVEPAMLVWLSLRTFCSRGSEISWDHIVLCLCLARCQNDRKADCKQALVFVIRMSGQAPALHLCVIH